MKPRDPRAFWPPAQALRPQARGRGFGPARALKPRARGRALDPARAFAFVLLLALAPSPPLAAASLRIERLAFLPASFGAGEEVEAIALLALEGQSPEPEAFSLEIGAGLPEPGKAADPEILGIRLSKGSGGWELRVRFRPWSPGAGLIPARSVAGSLLPPIHYATASVLGASERDPSPPKAQLELPGTALYLYGFIGLVILCVLLVAALLFWVLPGARRLLELWKAAQAHRALSRSLAFLESSLGKAEPVAFYAALARSLRLYLAARFLPEIPALTPRELAALPQDRFPAEGIREEAAALLAESDDVRFGGERPAPSAMTEALATAARIASNAEEALG